MKTFSQRLVAQRGVALQLREQLQVGGVQRMRRHFDGTAVGFGLM
jgi:hypothetical protein